MSFKNYRRSIILDFNYDEVKKGVPQANKQMALLNAEFRKQSEAANQAGSSIEKLQLKNETFANKVKIQADKVEKLKKELENLTSAENKNEKAITNKTIELKNAETQLMKYKKRSEETSKELKAQENIFGRTGIAIQDFADKSKAAGIDLEKLAGNMQKVGAVMTGIGIAAVKMAGTVDQEMAKVATIADTTNISMEELRKGAMKTSDDFNIAAAEVVQGLYNINSSNIDTAKSLDVLRASALLTKTGFTDMSTATDILTTIINSYGIAIEEVDTITDQLIITQKLGKLTVDELGTSFGKIAGLAATAQIPLEELLAAIATLTTRGVEASEAITGVRGIVSAVIKPTSQASEEAKKLGLQFDLAALQAKGFSGFLEDVQRKTRGNDESMAKLFGRIEGLNSMFILAGEEGAKLYAENVDEITNSVGTADEALEKIQTPIENLEAAWNRLKNTITESGRGLAPIVNMVAAFLDLIAKIPAKIITIITVLGMITLVIGTVAKTTLMFGGTLALLGTVFNFTVAPALLNVVGILGALAAAIGIVLALFLAFKSGAKEAGKEVENLANSASKATGNFQKEVETAQTQAVRKVRGSHRNGLKRVPNDNYIAELHKDEEVLRADDPRNRNNPNFNNSNQIVNVYVQADDLQQVADVVRLFEDVRQVGRAGVVHG